MTYDDIPEGCFFCLYKSKTTPLYNRLKIKGKEVLRSDSGSWRVFRVENPRWFDGTFTFKVVVPKEYC